MKLIYSFILKIFLCNFLTSYLSEFLWINLLEYINFPYMFLSTQPTKAWNFLSELMCKFWVIKRGLILCSSVKYIFSLLGNNINDKSFMKKIKKSFIVLSITRGLKFIVSIVRFYWIIEEHKLHQSTKVNKTHTP